MPLGNTVWIPDPVSKQNKDGRGAKRRKNDTVEGKKETTKDSKEGTEEFGKCELEDKVLTQWTNGMALNRRKERKERVQQESTERRTAHYQKKDPKEKR